MSFTWHHPSYYKKLKQNSGRPSVIGPSKDNVSEVHHIPPTMETTVGLVGSLNISSTHTQPKEDE
jgi:hypothetical protein